MSDIERLLCADRSGSASTRRGSSTTAGAPSLNGWCSSHSGPWALDRRRWAAELPYGTARWPALDGHEPPLSSVRSRRVYYGGSNPAINSPRSATYRWRGADSDEAADCRRHQRSCLLHV